jgi:hypothetical protein
VNDDVGAVGDGAAEVPTGAEGVVDDYGDAGLVRDGDDALEVGDVVFWIADWFELDRFVSDSAYGIRG